MTKPRFDGFTVYGFPCFNMCESFPRVFNVVHIIPSSPFHRLFLARWIAYLAIYLLPSCLLFFSMEKWKKNLSLSLSPLSERKSFLCIIRQKKSSSKDQKKEKEEEKENWRAQRGSIRRKIWKPEPPFLILKSDGIDFRLRKLHLRLDSTRCSRNRIAFPSRHMSVPRSRQRLNQAAHLSVVVGPGVGGAFHAAI